MRNIHRNHASCQSSNQGFLDLTAALDVAAFWAENEQCHAFTTAKPRCAASFSPDDHWLFEFLPVPSTVRYYQDKPYRDACTAQANAHHAAVRRQSFLRRGLLAAHAQTH